MSYEKLVRAQDNEKIIIRNSETNKEREVKLRKNQIPKNKVLIRGKQFSISNDYVTIRLRKMMSHIEYSIMNQMIAMAKYDTNSLFPLSEETSKTELAKTFDISKNSVQKVFNRLKELQVYATFDCGTGENAIAYWILNPYISWKGKYADEAIPNLFHGSLPHTFYLQEQMQ